jgi:hypothetical protein
MVLTVAVNASDTLLDIHRIPRQVEIEKYSGELQVNTFTPRQIKRSHSKLGDDGDNFRNARHFFDLAFIEGQIELLFQREDKLNVIQRIPCGHRICRGAGSHGGDIYSHYFR